MRSRALVLAMALAVTACGGSDPIQSAENCTELEQAVETELQALEDADKEDRNAVREQVQNKATELRGEALASGANLEAALCATMESLVMEIFDDIGSSLDD